MANDLMRTGPRGSSNQEASVGPQQFVLKDHNTTPNSTTFVKANTIIAQPEQGYFNTSWRVIAIELKVIVATLTNPAAISIGTDAATTAYVNAYSLVAGTAAGTIIGLPLNGTDVLLEFGTHPFGELELNQAIGSAAAGTYQVTVFAEPTAGRFYST